jgi:hypothetical protein
MHHPRISRRSSIGSIRRPLDALWFVGRCLGWQDSADTIETLRASIRDEHTDWLVVAGIANHHAVTPALWSALVRRNLVELLPTDLNAYLRLLYEMNSARNGLIRQQLLEAAICLNQAGIRPILMKGAITLFEAGCDAGASLMTDIDLLLRHEELPIAITALQSQGYRLLANPPPYAHAWTLHRPFSIASIDVHCDIGPQRLLLPPDAARAAAEPTDREDVGMDALSLSDRILVLIMTFAVFERHYFAGHIPLRGLTTLADLCHRRGSKIDWDYVANAVERNHMGAQAAAMFHMANSIMNVPVPITLRRAPSADRYLRRCLLQLAYPPLDQLRRAYAAVAWPFNRVRMDYRHNCGTRGWALAAARVRHAIEVVIRRTALEGWRSALSQRRT